MQWVAYVPLLHVHQSATVGFFDRNLVVMVVERTSRNKWMVHDVIEVVNPPMRE